MSGWFNVLALNIVILDVPCCLMVFMLQKRGGRRVCNKLPGGGRNAILAAPTESGKPSDPQLELDDNLGQASRFRAGCMISITLGNLNGKPFLDSSAVSSSINTRIPKFCRPWHARR